MTGDEVVILGVDPGLTGAIAAWTPHHFDVRDIPTLRIKKKTIIDHYALARTVDDLLAGNSAVAWVEHVSASPQMGVTSAFAFGRGYGIILGVLAANFIVMSFVTPNSWKVAMKAKGEKDEARFRASSLLRSIPGFSRIKDHGRADAALIALYGAEQVRR